MTAWFNASLGFGRLAAGVVVTITACGGRSGLELGDAPESAGGATASGGQSSGGTAPGGSTGGGSSRGAAGQGGAQGGPIGEGGVGGGPAGSPGTPGAGGDPGGTGGTAGGVTGGASGSGGTGTGTGGTGKGGGSVDGGGGARGGGFGGFGGSGDGGIVQCFSCITRNCPEARQCFMDPTCGGGISCVFTRCSGTGGLNMACVVDCFNGDVMAAVRLTQALQCVARECGGLCGVNFPGGGIPGQRDGG